MKLIVGLGNPGEKYENTRHNLGYLALDELIKKYEPLKKTFWEEDKKLRALTKEIKHNSTNLMLAKPTTFMNLSGESVSKIANYFKIKSEDIIVIYDELDLPFGKIRIRFGGGAGGHHGVESIISSLNTDQFLRIRLGIGNPRHVEGKEIKSKNTQNVNKYVLGSFTPHDKGKIKTMLKQAVRDVELILEHGIDTYMSKYHDNGDSKKEKKSESKSSQATL